MPTESELQIAADCLEDHGCSEVAEMLRGMDGKSYIVTAGSYSDYSIYGVFSSKEKAQEYIDKRIESGSSFGDTPNIEEWGMDAGLKECNHTRWHVGMFLDDGSIREGPSSGERFGEPVNEMYAVRAVPAYNNRPMVRVQSVESEEHAIKLAVEARQKWLRGDLQCR